MTGVFNAELKERARRFSYLALVALALFAAFWFVPRNDNSMQVMLIQPDRFIQAGNASWIPIASAWGLGFFLPLVGFFYLKNVLSEDIHNGLAQYVQASPLGNLRYILGKWMAGIVLLYGVTAIVILGAFVMQVLHFPGEWLSLYDFLSPYAYLLFVIPFFLAVAIFFDSVRFLRGALGSVIFIVAFISVYTLQAMDDSTPLWLRFVDLSGSTMIVRTIQEAVLEQSGLPMDIMLFLGGGLQTFNPTMQLVFHGTQFKLIDFIGLVGMLAISGSLVLLSAPVMAATRASEKVRLPKQNKRWKQKKEVVISDYPPAYTPVAIQHRTTLVLQIKAELVLLLAGQKFSWWFIALGGWLACFFAPINITQGILLPLLLLWFVNVFSALGSREHQYSFMQMVISSPGGVIRQTFASWLSAALLTFGMAIPLIVRLCLVGNVLGVMSCIAGSLFLPGFALFLGEITKTRRVFEMVFIVITYLIINSVSLLMFMGSPKAASLAAPITYSCIGLAFGISAIIKRTYVVNK